MKKMIFIVLFYSSISLYSQESPHAPIRLSLSEAIQTSLKNRFDVQSNKYNITIAETDVAKSKREWLPDLSASGNMRYSPEIQATYVPGGFFSADPSLIALGAKSLAIFGLDLNQTVFKPGISTDIQLAKQNLALESEKNKQEENDVKEKVALSYLNVLLRELQLKISSEEEHRYEAYATIAQGKFEQGAMLENDYLKAKLDYENAKVESRKSSQNRMLAMDHLKYQMNMPAETEFLLVDTLHSAGLNTFLIETKGDPNSRTEIKQLLIQQEIHKLQLNKSKQFALPTLSVYGNYSKQFTYTNLDYSLGKWWSSFSYVGLHLSVPITANFKNNASLTAYKAKIQQADLDLKQQSSDIHYEIQKASNELNNARQNMQMTKSNYDLSKQIYESQIQQYALGMKQYIEVLETNRTLNAAEQNYIKAVYDFLVSSIAYQKAIGNY